MYKFSNYFLYICYKMSRMPKLSMEIEPAVEGLAEESYLQKPQLPKSTDVAKEKPPKKKRVMSEKQLANLAKAREKSALNRRLKKEEKIKEKEALKEQKKLAKKKTPIASTTAENLDVIEEEDYVEEGMDDADNYYGAGEADEEPESNYTNGIDYEFIMANVYGMIKEDQHKEREQAKKAKEEEERMLEAKNAYDERIRKEERDRLMGIVKEKKSQRSSAGTGYNPLKPQEPNWDSCFQPRGRGGDNFF